MVKTFLQSQGADYDPHMTIGELAEKYGIDLSDLSNIDPSSIVSDIMSSDNFDLSGILGSFLGGGAGGQTDPFGSLFGGQGGQGNQGGFGGFGGFGDFGGFGNQGGQG